MKKKFIRLVGALVALAALGVAAFYAFRFKARMEMDSLGAEASKYRIKVVLGFHASFRHSWRGDAPDETGWGKDIRLVRHILKTLDEANEAGLDARGSWDWNIRWSINEIVKNQAPDILESLKRRVADGKDEIISGPWNNGMLNASDPKEFDASVARSISNSKGTGMRDLFGHFTPVMRPQEMMFSPSHIARYKRLGIDAISLYYSSVAFNSISNFIEPLTETEQFNPLTLVDPEGKNRMTLIPTYNPADVVNQASLRLWLIKLRKKQISGEIPSDILLYINSDADGDQWAGVELPAFLQWMPNAGGLKEIIDIVNQFDFAEFGRLDEYMAAHPPTKEIVVAEDLADGGYDGFASWAEKWDARKVWTGVEASRMNEAKILRIMGLGGREDAAFEKKVDETFDDLFERRLESLSTTHYGMASPLLNDERQQHAYAYGKLLQSESEKILREAESRVRDRLNAAQPPPLEADEFRFLLYDSSVGADRSFESGFALIADPLQECVKVDDPDEFRRDHALSRGNGKTLPWTLLPDFDRGPECLTLAFSEQIWARQPAKYALSQGPNSFYENNSGVSADEKSLTNGLVTLKFGDNGFPTSFETKGGQKLGGENFLRSGVTYRLPAGERSATVDRMEIKAVHSDGGPVAFVEQEGAARFGLNGVDYEMKLRLRWTAVAGQPGIRVDIEALYPYTPKAESVGGVGVSVARPADVNWREAFPFELSPILTGVKDDPIRIWRRDFIGRVGSYSLDFPAIERSGGLTSLNNHVTNGWMAAATEEGGLLIAQDSTKSAGFAFAPVRVHYAPDGGTSLSINSFGAYSGPQWSYPAFGGNGLGAELLECVATQLRSPAPGYNGRRERFALLLAPYEGGEPTSEIRSAAELFYHPPGAIRLDEPKRAPEVPEKPVCATPRTFRASSHRDGFIAVWDAPEGWPDEADYIVAWRPAGSGDWTKIETNMVREEQSGLTMDAGYDVRVWPAGCEDNFAEAAVTTGEIEDTGTLKARKEVSLNLLAKLFNASLPDLFYRP